MTQTQAYREGFKAGKADKRLGIRLTVSWLSFASDPQYQQEYSAGYRAGQNAGAAS